MTTDRCVALYCRISKDKSGHEEGVDLQEGWGREYAAKTWPGVPIQVFKDNDMSGDDPSRPAYVEFLKAVKRGEIGHLWCVEPSRLARDEILWFTLEAKLIEAKIEEIHSRRKGLIQVGSVTGRILAVIAADERRTMLQRLSDNITTKAAMGRPSGVTPFGYRRVPDVDGRATYEIVPEQADAIRFAADKVLAGWSLSNVAAALREQGFVGVKRRWTYADPVKKKNPISSRPTEITQQTVRSMLTNHAVAGLRVHKGVPYKGVWEPILDMVTWEAVRSKLGGSRVVTRADGATYTLTSVRRPGATVRKYLLTGGLAVCGVCDAPLVASKRPRAGAMYLCNPVAGGKGCVGILAEPLEQYVVDRLLERLNQPDFLNELKGDDESAARRDELVAALAAIENERNEMSTMVGEGGMSPEMFRNFLTASADRERRLRAELASVPAPVSIIDPARIAEDWGDMSLQMRREVVSMFISRVTINRARPGIQVFDPSPPRVMIGGLD